ncbi:glycosyltransferase family 2 protein [Pseudoroseicyclus sp. H15]
MRYDSLQSCLAARPGLLARGPVAVILAEDAVELGSTLAHHLRCGFQALLVFADPGLKADAPELEDPRVARIDLDVAPGQTAPRAVNAVIGAAPTGTWLYYCYGAEYLFYPFSETRSVGEMLGFVAEERRDAVLTYVIDLYAADLTAAPDAVSLEDAHIDRNGYYALARPDPANHGHPKDRQLDFYGGLRWRFEEHVPEASRRIDRVALFRTKPGLKLLADHRLSDEEMNTYACPWHHSLTAAICSFRTAKALKRNPGSTFAINDFLWSNSVPFDWHSQQLLDLGLMEPGQWF